MQQPTGSPLYRLCDRILIHFYSLHKVQTIYVYYNTNV